MKNNATKNSSKLSSIKFIKGIKPKIKQPKINRSDDNLMFFLGQA